MDKNLSRGISDTIKLTLPGFMSKTLSINLKKSVIKGIAFVFCVVTLSSCSTMTPTQQRVLSGAGIGAVGGAVVGGLTAGSPAAGAAVGAAVGAGLGAAAGALTK
jgi:osmotically inducible lipoprotein OsmB